LEKKETCFCPVIELKYSHCTCFRASLLEVLL